MGIVRSKYNNGEWTKARYFSFIKSTLRSASQRWPPKYKVLSKAKRGKMTNVKTGRMAEHYECNACKGLFPSTEVEVNHIIPVIPVTGFDSWDATIDRMFCEEDVLEVVCKPCHKSITEKEKLERKTNCPKSK